jgi:hypothetical protein
MPILAQNSLAKAQPAKMWSMQPTELTRLAIDNLASSSLGSPGNEALFSHSKT